MPTIDADPDDHRRRPRRLTFAVWRNPLARPADRTEAGLLLLAVALWLVALPIVAVAASIIWSGISDTADAQEQGRTMVTAHLLAKAPESYYSPEYGSAITPPVPVSAQWTGLDGRSHSGTVDANYGAHVGDELPIWIDDSGEVTAPPISTGTAAVLMVAATGTVWLSCGALLIGCWAVVRWRLNRRRFLDWDTQWETIEPVWSGR